MGIFHQKTRTTRTTSFPYDYSLVCSLVKCFLNRQGDNSIVFRLAHTSPKRVVDTPPSRFIRPSIIIIIIHSRGILQHSVPFRNNEKTSSLILRELSINLHPKPTLYMSTKRPPMSLLLLIATSHRMQRRPIRFLPIEFIRQGHSRMITMTICRSGQLLPMLQIRTRQNTIPLFRNQPRISGFRHQHTQFGVL